MLEHLDSKKRACKREKEKEENAGFDIKLDFRRRELLKDGITIDKYQLSIFFRKWSK